MSFLTQGSVCKNSAVASSRAVKLKHRAGFPGTVQTVLRKAHPGCFQRGKASPFGLSFFSTPQPSSPVFLQKRLHLWPDWLSQLRSVTHSATGNISPSPSLILFLMPTLKPSPHCTGTELGMGDLRMTSQLIRKPFLEYSSLIGFTWCFRGNFLGIFRTCRESTVRVYAKRATHKLSTREWECNSIDRN